MCRDDTKGCEDNSRARSGWVEVTEDALPDLEARLDPAHDPAPSPGPGPGVRVFVLTTFMAPSSTNMFSLTKREERGHVSMILYSTDTRCVLITIHQSQRPNRKCFKLNRNCCA